MYKVILFAGTTEGRKIAEFLAESGVETLVLTATEYGSTMMEQGETLHVSSGRRSREEMETLFRTEMPELVIDSTHPFAREVTENIQAAAQESGRTYRRVIRQTQAAAQAASQVSVGSVEEAVRYLEGTTGRILVTTGSKEIAKYTELADFEDRLVVRVLPSEESLALCREAGLEGSNLICMHGPFTADMNAAMIRQYDCRYLVTKMTGAAGGFEEKLAAAEETGAVPIVIGAPQEEGLSCYDCMGELCKTFAIQTEQYVALVGIGMGTGETLTQEAAQAIREAELIIGAGRMVASVDTGTKAVLTEYDADKIRDFIADHPQYRKIAVLLSGDGGFYSGAKKLTPKLAACGCRVFRIPGISSVSYFMNRIQLSWEDAVLVSNHGVNQSLIPLVRDHEKVFSLLGRTEDVATLAGKLMLYGLSDVKLYVGERLSYEDEKITSGRPEDFVLYENDPLCVVCVINRRYEKTRIPSGGVQKDAAFIRGKVPMTKEEVRAVSLAKLGVTEDAICYDVGAGTGSVSVEMALRARRGRVFAIEKKEEAVTLIQENQRKFKTDNLEIISGEAPEALADLPAPTHVFIGGTSGKMEEIIDIVKAKNPEARIVINCIALESVSKALACASKYGEPEVVQVQVSRGDRLAGLTMMKGENPITIVTV